MENRQGLILDYQMHGENISDAKLVEPTIKRLQESMKLPVKKLWADRGMFSAANEAMLATHGIQSGLCPRNPDELKQRMEQPGVRAGMKRRGSTEARVAILKNVILSSPVREKSLEARQKACGWAVLSHNLWVLARMPQAQKNKGQPSSTRAATAAREERPAA